MIVELNKLDINLRNAKSFLKFRNFLLKIGRQIQNPTDNIHYPMGIKYLIRLRIGHLTDHKFRYNFQNCLNPLGPCSLEVQSTIHYFQHCHYYNDIRKTFLDTIKNITNISVSNLSDEYLVKLLMYGNPSNSFHKNKEIIEASLKFILTSKRFAGFLM